MDISVIMEVTVPLVACIFAIAASCSCTKRLFRSTRPGEIVSEHFEECKEGCGSTRSSRPSITSVVRSPAAKRHLEFDDTSPSVKRKVLSPGNSQEMSEGNTSLAENRTYLARQIVKAMKGVQVQEWEMWLHIGEDLYLRDQLDRKTDAAVAALHMVLTNISRDMEEDGKTLQSMNFRERLIVLKKAVERINSSSTIVPATVGSAVAPFCTVCSRLDGGNSSGPKATSSVNCYTSVRIGDRSHICSLKTEPKPYQVSLRC